MKTYQRAIALCLLATLALAAGLPAKPSHIVMGYARNWDSTFSSANQNARLSLLWNEITHIAEAFALPQANGGALSQPNTVRSWLAGVAHTNNTYAMLSVGGATASDAYWQSSTDTPAHLASFVTNIMNLVGTYGYDGVDVDWEFPNADNLAPAQTTQFTNLILALSDALKNPGNPDYKGLAYDGTPKQLTFYISPGYDICGMDFNNAALQAAVDFASLPGYDLYAGTAGEHVGPIDKKITDTTGWSLWNCRNQSKFLTVSSNHGAITGGGGNFSFPSSKLVLGIPGYDASGTAFRTVTGSGSKTLYDSTYRESQWSNGSWLTDGEAVCGKLNWAFQRSMKGCIIWELAQLSPRNVTAATALFWDAMGGSSGCLALGTPTASQTPSFTRTSSYTRTPSATFSVSPTLTATRTVSPTQSPSSSASESPTLTPSPTESPTPLGTYTASPSFSPSFTVSETALATFTASDTPTASFMPSPSDTPSLTASPTETVVGLASPSPTQVSGSDTEIEEFAAMPNPQSGPNMLLAIRLKGSADKLRVRIYSAALTLVAEVNLGSASPGWNLLAGTYSQKLASGAYFIKISAYKDEKEFKGGKTGKYFYLSY